MLRCVDMDRARSFGYAFYYGDINTNWVDVILFDVTNNNT